MGGAITCSVLCIGWASVAETVGPLKPEAAAEPCDAWLSLFLTLYSTSVLLKSPTHLSFIACLLGSISMMSSVYVPAGCSS